MQSWTQSPRMHWDDECDDSRKCLSSVQNKGLKCRRITFFSSSWSEGWISLASLSAGRRTRLSGMSETVNQNPWIKSTKRLDQNSFMRKMKISDAIDDHVFMIKTDMPLKWEGFSINQAEKSEQTLKRC